METNTTPRYQVNGISKDLQVYDNKVVLIDKKVKGLLYYLLIIVWAIIIPVLGGLIVYWVWNAGNGKEKVIYTKHIKSVELKKPGSFSVGMMQFNLDGRGHETELDDYASENSITFNSQEEYLKCVQIRDFLETIIA